MSSVNKKPGGLLPGIIFLAVCGALAGVLIQRQSENSKKPEAPHETPPVAATNQTFALTVTNSAPQNEEERAADLVNEGNQFLVQGNFAEAVKKFEEAVAISPEQEDLHYNLAIALGKLGKTEEAKKEYAEALRIFPDYVEALNNLGNLLMNENKLEEAAARFREAIKNAPDNAAFHNNLGTALGRQKKIDEARAEFEAAVKKDPTFVQARVNLANSLLANNRVEEAITHLDEALRLKPDFGPALQTMQRARQRLAK
jgi:Tfp pilus assembly protein PilF